MVTLSSHRQSHVFITASLKLPLGHLPPPLPPPPRSAIYVQRVDKSVCRRESVKVLWERSGLLGGVSPGAEHRGGCHSQTQQMLEVELRYVVKQ